MKKRKLIQKILLLSLFALMVLFSASLNNRNVDSMTNLTLTNVEALAQSESSNPCRYCKFTTLQICWEDDVQGCLGERTIWEI